MSNATTTNGKAPSQDVVAVIVGALAAMGYSADQIAHIRPIVSYNWKMEGRLRGDVYKRQATKNAHTPMLLDEALSWHKRFTETGSMKDRKSVV